MHEALEVLNDAASDQPVVVIQLCGGVAKREHRRVSASGGRTRGGPRRTARTPADLERRQWRGVSERCACRLLGAEGAATRALDERRQPICRRRAHPRRHPHLLSLVQPPTRAPARAPARVRPHTTVGALDLPNREAITRLIGAVLAEQHDEWTEQRRYLGLDALARARGVLAGDTDPKEETPTLDRRPQRLTPITGSPTYTTLRGLTPATLTVMGTFITVRPSESMSAVATAPTTKVVSPRRWGCVCVGPGATSGSRTRFGRN